MKRFSVVLAAALAAPLWATAGMAETLSYAYDPLGRLVGVVSDVGATAKAATIYRYDKADNRSLVNVVKFDSTKAPVFRYINSALSHAYALNLFEAAGANYDIEQVAFSLFTSGGTGKIALYRCYGAAEDDHFISTASNCEGQTSEGLLGYAATASGTGLQEVRRYYKASIKDHLITTNFTEATSAGYVYEMSLGYVM